MAREYSVEDPIAVPPWPGGGESPVPTPVPSPTLSLQPSASPQLPQPACSATLTYYSYTVSGGWLYVNMSSALYGEFRPIPLEAAGAVSVFNPSCTLANGITYVGGPVRQVVVYSGGQGYPVEAGNTWVDMTENPTLITSASIPLPKVGSYTFQLVAGTFEGGRLVADVLVPVVVSATYVPPPSATSAAEAAQAQAAQAPWLASLRRWLDRYWWTIPLAAAAAAVVYVAVDPPQLDEVAKAIAGSKWARAWASAFVNPNLPPEERERALQELQQWLGARVAEDIYKELGSQPPR